MSNQISCLFLTENRKTTDWRQLQFDELFYRESVVLITRKAVEIFEDKLATPSLIH